MAFASKLVFAALYCLFVKVGAIGCGDYGDEESCNYINKYTIFGCKYNASGCHMATCSDYDSSATVCRAAMGGKCAWNESRTASSKCSSASCMDFDSESETECTNNYAGLECKYNSGSSEGFRCFMKSCSDYDETVCGAGDTKPTSRTCVWDAEAASCKSLGCDSYTTSEACLASDGPTGKLSCYWNETMSTKCQYASCSNFYSEQSVCENNNGKMDCVFDGSWSAALLRCSKRSCSDQKSENACKNWGGCWWSSLRSRCLTSDCEDLDASQAVCESEHPICHYDGTCKEGADSGAKAISVSSLVMLLLLVFCSFLF